MKKFKPYIGLTVLMFLSMTGTVLANRPPIYVDNTLPDNTLYEVTPKDEHTQGFTVPSVYCVWGGEWRNVKFKSTITNGIVVSLNRVTYENFPPFGTHINTNVTSRIGYQCYDTESYIKIPEDLPYGYYHFTTTITANNALYGKSIIETPPIRFVYEDHSNDVPVVEKSYRREFLKSTPNKSNRTLTLPNNKKK